MNQSKEHVQTVFVIDDDITVCESLSVMIQSMGWTVSTYSSATKFQKEYRPEFPGCLILDVTLPVHNGLDLYRQLLESGKRLPVIFISDHPVVSTVVAAMKLGAIEFLEKPISSHVLKRNIEEAMRVDRNWREQEKNFNALHQQITSLTERERETLELLVQGETNKSMAAKLYITERAIEMRRANIMSKLQVRSVAELLDRAITHRLLSQQREAAKRPHLV